MGRPRTKHKNLPALVCLKRGRYYYGRNQVFCGTTLAEAYRFAADREEAKDGKKPQTFADLAVWYRKDVIPSKAPRTRKDNEAELIQLLLVFGQAPLEEIQPHFIRGYLDNRPAKVRGNREIALFSAIWNWGRSTGRLNLPNPCDGVKRNKEIPRDKLVSPEELAAEYAVASQPLKDALDLYNMLGLRVSELLTLSLTDERGGLLHVKQWKTGKILRFVVEGDLEAILTRIKARQFKAGDVVSLAVIRDERGRRMTYDGLEKRHRRARLKAGVDFNLQDLRGKHGTERADQEGIRSAQRALGHASVTMTERYVKARAGEKVSILRKDSPITDKGSG